MREDIQASSSGLAIAGQFDGPKTDMDLPKAKRIHRNVKLDRAALLRSKQSMTESAPAPLPVAGLSFEAAMAELELIVRRLEGGDVNLEESVALYERGQALRQHCEARLKAAELRVEQVAIGVDGQPSGTTGFGEG